MTEEAIEKVGINCTGIVHAIYYFLILPQDNLFYRLILLE
jgi:hypothetical protein